MQEAIKDRSGRIIGFFIREPGKTMVLDASGRILGWCAGGKTYNASGAIVAHEEVPGILLR